MSKIELKDVGEERLVGKVTHYFGNISVAVIKLDGTLKVGDTVRVVGGSGASDFTQIIESMEIDHKKAKIAKKGDSVGVKVEQKVREGDKVYKA